MKNFLIIVLSLALAAAAFATRPSEAQFRAYLNGADPATAAVTERGTPGQKIFKVLGRAAGLTSADAPRDYTFRDCYLWVDVQREGKTVYVGAFAHFFDVSRFGGNGTGGTEPSNDQTRPATDEQPAPAVASARVSGQSRHGRHGS